MAVRNGHRDRIAYGLEAPPAPRANGKSRYLSIRRAIPCDNEQITPNRTSKARILQSRRLFAFFVASRLPSVAIKQTPADAARLALAEWPDAALTDPCTSHDANDPSAAVAKSSGKRRRSGFAARGLTDEFGMVVCRALECGGRCGTPQVWHAGLGGFRR